MQTEIKVEGEYEHDYDELFRREYTRIARDAYFILGDSEAAHDAAMEAFSRLYANWAKVCHYEKPAMWLRKVAIRIAVVNRKHWFRELAHHTDEPFSDTTTPAIHFDLKLAIATLPRSERAAIMLYYFDDLPIQDVASCLGCRPGTAKNYLFRAREHLSQELIAKGVTYG